MGDAPAPGVSRGCVAEYLLQIADGGSDVLGNAVEVAG